VSDSDIRCDIVECGRRLYTRGLIAANEGNISIRDGDVLYITPAGVSKGFLTPEMLVRTDMNGRPLDPKQRASTEVLMHLAVYRRRNDVSAVVHAHPPTATGFAVGGIALDRPVIAEAVVTLGQIPVIPYGQPSTHELADNVGNAICEAHGLLLANHGALTVGEGIWRAWERMETLEQLARVSLVTRVLGRDNLLPDNDVERLMASRAGSGYPPPACVDCPSCGETVSMGDKVVLSRIDLVRLVAEAVEHFAGRRST
jgi:L-fuculose-phosphate aldolase